MAIKIAIFWWVYIKILTKPDMILNEFFIKLDDLTARIPKLNKLLSCEYCLAGFTTFWVYIFTTKYNFFEHLFTVSLSILFVQILNTFLSNEEN